MRKGIILLLFVCAFLNAQTKINFENGKTRSVIHISVFDNVIYLPVIVNNSPCENFVLDTGAPDLSIVDEKVASRLNLNSSKGGSIFGSGSANRKFSILKDVVLSFPDFKVADARTGSFSLAFMESYWGKPKDGLIGGNILNKLITELDYINKKITFSDPGKFTYRGRGEVVKTQIKNNSIFVNAIIGTGDPDKKIEGRFIIDTAVRNTFFNSPFCKKNKLIEKSGKVIENITGFGIGGEGFGKLGRINSLQIGGSVLKNPIIEFTTDTKGISASKDFDGIIGADILSRFNIVLDYIGGRIILEPNEQFNDIFEYDKSGIYLIVDNENRQRYKAAYIVKGSPAERAGILKNDIILELNGKNVKEIDYERIKNILKQPGTTINLKLLRQGKEKLVDIKLETIL